MPALDAEVATAALTDVHVELAMDWSAGNFDLILLLNVDFVNGSAAVRTGLGQGSLMGFVDLLRRRWLTMGLYAVVVARFAARLFGLALGLAFGERGGLTLAGAAQFLKETRQALYISAEIGNFTFKADTVKAW
jgi:hypothetical protein